MKLDFFILQALTSLSRYFCFVPFCKSRDQNLCLIAAFAIRISCVVISQYYRTCDLLFSSGWTADKTNRAAVRLQEASADANRTNAPDETRRSDNGNQIISLLELLKTLQHFF